VPSWGEILKVLQTEAQLNGGVDLDGARHKYISQLQVLTGRNTVLYTTDYLGKGGPQTSINLGDMQGLMEVFKGLLTFSWVDYRPGSGGHNPPRVSIAMAINASGL